MCSRRREVPLCQPPSLWVRFISLRVLHTCRTCCSLPTIAHGSMLEGGREHEALPFIVWRWRPGQHPVAPPAPMRAARSANRQSSYFFVGPSFTHNHHPSSPTKNSPNPLLKIKRHLWTIWIRSAAERKNTMASRWCREDDMAVQVTHTVVDVTVFTDWEGTELQAHETTTSLFLHTSLCLSLSAWENVGVVWRKKVHRWFGNVRPLAFFHDEKWLKQKA